MLNRTTSILPEGLFASLGVPRADENLRDAKHVRTLSIQVDSALLKEGFAGPRR